MYAESLYIPNQGKDRQFGFTQVFMNKKMIIPNVFRLLLRGHYRLILIFKDGEKMVLSLTCNMIMVL